MAKVNGETLFLCSLADAKRYARANALTIEETVSLPTRNYEAAARFKGDVE